MDYVFINILFIIAGGGLGSACRYLFSLLAVKWFGNSFPLGTLGVNLIGCFLIGLGFSLAGRIIISPTVRLLLMTGFLGGLTTFSTYALESTNFMGNGQFLTALGNIALNNIGGLALVFLGLWLGRTI
jgi:CrcB protein